MERGKGKRGWRMEKEGRIEGWEKEAGGWTERGMGKRGWRKEKEGRIEGWEKEAGGWTKGGTE